jgi:hypothetical protein
LVLTGQCLKGVRAGLCRFNWHRPTPTLPFHHSKQTHRFQISSQHALAALLINLRQLQPAEALLTKCLERIKQHGGGGGGGGGGMGLGGTEALALEAET